MILESVEFFSKFPELNNPPKFSDEHAGWFDIQSAETVVVPHGEWITIHTGLYIHIGNPNFRLRLESRSGLASKSGIIVFGGCIDPNYQGEIHVILYNIGKLNYNIQKGDRICEAGFEQVFRPGFKAIPYHQNITTDEFEGEWTIESTRGKLGRGSTGK